MAAIVPGVIERWFTPRFQKADPAAVESIATMLRNTPPQGYVACCAAVRDMDQRTEIAAINAPTLVISGTHDGATPPTMASRSLRKSSIKWKSEKGGGNA
jgi:3-oxoadipate enol-lactonase